jgi:hypothetical protein
MGELRVMGKEGDAKVIWNPENDDEVAAARRTFDDLRAKGHLAYSVREEGRKGEMIRAFDPNAGKIILAPPMAGG